MRPISLVLLCIALVPLMLLAQTAKIDALKEKAEKGDDIAQYLLGETYQGGHGVPIDGKEAAKWYRRSAEQGHSFAQDALGFMYLTGYGVSKDKKESLKWFRKAAEQGRNRSAYYLGLAYYNGDGVLEDYEEAVKWYRRAVGILSPFLGGEPEFALGVMYANGYGVTKDEKEAFKWFREGADQGDVSAQFNLGLAYDNGNGVPENDKEAVKWYRHAADRDEPSAQANLGLLYALGNGVPENLVEAYKWFNLAAAQGIEVARENKDLVAKKMTAEQIAEAQKLSAAWKPWDPVEFWRSLPKSSRKQNEVSYQSVAFGSGFYVTSNGYLLTNQHVVDGARQVFVYSGSRQLPARVVKTDAANDLALLKVDGAFSPLPVSSSRRVKLGQTVSTVGFPNPALQGKSPKLTKGEISSLSGASDDPKYFQISIPLQPGNSGGPLVDAYGNVVGVVTAKLSAGAALAKTGDLPENVNYAVKGTFVMGFLESVPDVAAEMLDPKPRRSREFTEVVSEAEKASVMILVYE